MNYLTKLILIRIICNHNITASSKNNAKVLTAKHLSALDIAMLCAIINLKYETFSQQVDILIIGMPIRMRVPSEGFPEFRFNQAQSGTLVVAS